MTPLHCYAPTTSGHFAEWAGITKSDAKERWGAVADALVPVQGKRKGSCWRRISTPWTSHRRHPGPGPRRPLPRSGQPQGRVPTLGGPGVVLHEALPVATWRGAAKGRRYQVTVAPLATLTKAVRAEI